MMSTNKNKLEWISQNRCKHFKRKKMEEYLTTDVNKLN